MSMTMLYILTPNKFIDTIIKYIISLVFGVLIFSMLLGLTVITGHLPKADHRKLGKTWVSEAPRHVPD